MLSLNRARATLGAPAYERDQGAVVVLLAVIILPLVLVFALCVDVARLLVSKSQQANNAEYAAVAAVEAYASSSALSIPQRKTIAIEVAEKIASRNLLLGRPGAIQVAEHELRDEVAGIIRFGTWDSATGLFTEVPPDTACNSVKVELETRPSTSVVVFFARSIGVTDINVKSKAQAYYDGSPGDPGKPNVYLIQTS